MAKEIKIHSESPNSYGIIVLTSGIDWSRFDANPVMLDTHNDTLILGKWSGRTIQGKDVLSTPVFNEENEHAASKMQEYEGGFLNGASIGIDFDFDDIQVNPALGYGDAPVLVKCECYEASLCAIPSNPEALKMKAGGERLNAAEFKKKLQLKLSATQESQNNQHTMLNLTLLKTALGLAASTSDEDTIAATISKINDATAKEKELSELKLSMQTAKDAEIKDMLDAAEREGKFTPAERSEYEAQAKLNLSFTRKVLNMTKGTVTFTPTKKPLDLLSGGEGGAGKLELTAETYDKLHKSNKLSALKKSDREAYDALLLAKKSNVGSKGIVDTK